MRHARSIVIHRRFDLFSSNPRERDRERERGRGGIYISVIDGLLNLYRYDINTFTLSMETSSLAHIYSPKELNRFYSNLVHRLFGVRTIHYAKMGGGFTLSRQRPVTVSHLRFKHISALLFH